MTELQENYNERAFCLPALGLVIEKSRRQRNLHTYQHNRHLDNVIDDDESRVLTTRTSTAFQFYRNSLLSRINKRLYFVMLFGQGARNESFHFYSNSNKSNDTNSFFNLFQVEQKCQYYTGCNQSWTCTFYRKETNYYQMLFRMYKFSSSNINQGDDIGDVRLSLLEMLDKNRAVGQFLQFIINLEQSSS